MKRLTHITATAGALALLLAACTPGTGGPAGPSDTRSTNGSSAPATPATIDGPPITLRLAVADPDDRPSRSAIDDLVQQVAERSGGKITIVPEYRAGDPRFEEGVVHQVLRGDTDLGLASARAWDLAGETTFQALQAPFLIDNDALMEAVARSDVAAETLAGLDGALGLAMWPEDIRYVAFFLPCNQDLRTPEAMRGATILVQPSALSNLVLATLGANIYPTLEADRNIDAGTCELQGMEAGLSVLSTIPMQAKPVAYGDLALWPKYQVLAMSRTSDAALNDAQRSLLRAVAMDVANASLERHDTAADLGPAFCAAGGEIRHAGAPSRQAWDDAMKRVYDALATDATTDARIDRIRELKAATSPSSGLSACGGTAPTPVPIEDIDTTGYVGTMPPNGTYRRELIAEDLIAAGLDRELAYGNEQVLTLLLDDGRFTFTWDAKNGSGTCQGTYRSDGQAVQFRDSPGGSPECGGGNDQVWRQEPDGISFIVLDPTYLPSDHILLDHWVWTRIK